MTLIVLAVLLLAVLGVPLFAIFAFATLIGYLRIADLPLAVFVGEIHKLTESSALTALPLFTFAGFLLAESRSPERMVRLTRALLGWLPGGLAIVTLIACAIFTAFTGASGVTIIALGGLLLPALQKDHYPERFSYGLLTSSGSLGLLFPPSLPVILYGLVSQVPVNDLYLAGVLPGVFLLLLLALFSSLVMRRAPLYSFQLREALQALWEIRYELPLPFLVLGGIYGGFFTISEASAVMAMYVFVVEVFLYRDIPLKKLPAITAESLGLLGAIILILGSALGFTNFLVDQQIPMRIFEWFGGFIHTRLEFLLILNIFVLVFGALLDVFSAMIVLPPLILPIAREYGVDPVHLGIVFLTNLEIGYFMPPMGINLFLASFRFRRSILELAVAILPFFAIYLAGLLFITYWDRLSLWWR